MKEKEIITSHKFYPAWEYDKEEQDLNEASKNGLQLIHGGCFYSKFKKDENLRYIYQLDYHPRIENKERYVELFEELGWKYINSTFNGWHYFRRPYEEGMDVSEHKIYSDQQSLQEMHNRWLRILLISAILTMIGTVFYFAMGILEKEYLLLVDGIAFAILSITIFSGIRSARGKKQGKNYKNFISFQVTFPVCIVLTFIVLILSFIV